MKNEELLLLLIDSFIKIAEAGKKTKAGRHNRLLDAEGLGFKFFAHSASILYLFRSTNIPDSTITKISFFDAGSINVLGRTAIESFLVFNYVFVNNDDTAQEDFNYLSWVLGGLIERQNLPISSPQGKEIIEHELTIINNVKKELESNKYFQALTSKQQNQLFNNGKWRLKSWTQIGLESGLSDSYAKVFYSYLCGYAHASNLSVLQLREARDKKSQIVLCNATIGYLLIAMSKFIIAYTKVFPKSVPIFKSLKYKAIVDVWDSIGSKSLKDVDVDWSDFKI